MSRKKISTTVYLTEEQAVALKQLKARTRIPEAEYIREGIDLMLEAARSRGLLDHDALQPNVAIAPIGEREKVNRSLELDDAVERALRRLLPAGLLDGKH